MPFSLRQLSKSELEALAESRTPESLKDRAEPESMPPAFVASRALKLLAAGQPYERAPVGEYYDDNWVRAEVFVSVGAFKGKYTAAFLTSDFVGFREELQVLHQSLSGQATFSTLEEQLSLKLSGNGRGGISLAGVAVDAPGTR
jgi:hypothetical protein